MQPESPSTQMNNQLTRRDFAIRTAGFGWLWDSRPLPSWRRLTKLRPLKLRRQSRIHIPSSIRNFFLRSNSFPPLT